MRFSATFKISMLIALFLVSTSQFVSGISSIRFINLDVPITTNLIDLSSYEKEFESFNTRQEMTLSPFFTPDNAIEIHAAWIDRANNTIEIQNQYITQWDSGSWDDDSSPLVRSVVDAHNRNVTVRVQVNQPEPDDLADDVTVYFLGLGIQVRWMGNSDSPDGKWLSQTHNKLLMIDDKITLLSSINFGENAFTRNREAGMVIQNEDVTGYYQSIFEADWSDGEVPVISLSVPSQLLTSRSKLANEYPSHTNIPRSNFTGTYNVSAFTNPDNADKLIFKYLEAAQKSIYVSMYTISRDDFTNTLIDLKNANPSIDIQVLISNRRVGGSENEDTHAAATALTENLIPVYNSTKDDDKVDGFYHNKYWIIDGKHTFVYSGNWSPRSVTPEDTSYSSGDANRDMGIAVHDATDIASFFKTEVWDMDVAVADAWELPVGAKITSLENGDVISNTITVTGTLAGLSSATVTYRWNSGTSVTVIPTGEAFSFEIDTNDLPNGVNTLVVDGDLNEQHFSDIVILNVVNTNNEWRLLITEVLPNPDVVSDSDGEFFEITNSFPFDLTLTNWLAGDDNHLYIFDENHVIEGYSSIIIARNLDGFNTGFGKTADFELSISLINSDDYIQLLDNKDNIIDIVSYGEIGIDNSEALDAPDAGISIQRSPMHIDTNTAADFIYATPDPKGPIAHEPLDMQTSMGTTSSIDTSDSTITNLVGYMIPMIFVPLLSRRKKQRN